jgi:hypothetical protein
MSPTASTSRSAAPPGARAAGLPQAAVVLLAVLAGAGALSACGTAPTSDLDAKGWAGDLRLLRDSIAAIHPNPYRDHGPDAWRRAVDSILAELPDMEPHEAALSVHRVAALASDGHTEPARFAAHPALRDAWLPLLFRRFTDGWFVRTGHRRYAGLFGRRIVRIGDLPVETVADRVRPYVSSDNRLGALDDVGDAMRLSAVLEAVGAVDAVGADVPIVAEDPATGERRTISVRPGEDSWVAEGWMDADDALTDAPDPLYRSIEANYGYRYRPADSLAYVWFGKIRDGEDETIEAFFARVFRDVGDRPVGRFVLDLRENAGGNLELSGPVLRGVLRSPRIDRPGRLFVVVGRDTYSAAMHLSVLLERHTHALFVGEPTGATPNHFGDTRTVTLPHSGIEVEISTLYWQNSDPRDDRPWITPDLRAPLSSRDFFAHRDPALERIRSLVVTDSLVRGFGEPMRRWRRARQARRWPPLGIR